MGGQHKVLSPSSASRRIICAGSLAAACRALGLAPGVPMPDSAASWDSASGTCTHSIVEHCLRTKTEPEQFLDRTLEADGFKFEIDQERVDRCNVLVTNARKEVGRLLIEVKLDTSHVLGVPDQGGTGDQTILNRGKRQVVVRDVKDGIGIVFAWVELTVEQAQARGWFEPEIPRWLGANAQLMEYGAAALDQFSALEEWESVRLEIDQPRIDHFDTVTFTVAEVKAWLAHFAPREQLAYRLWKEGTEAEILANLVPNDEACKWCPIKSTCSKRADSIMSMFPVTPTFTSLTVTNEQLAKIMDKADDVIAFYNDARAEALRRAMAGHEIGGWKSVQGRQGNRKWIDAAKTEEFYRTKLAEKDVPNLFTEPELVSPTEAEKRCKKGGKDLWVALQGHITRADGGYSLVRDHDKRQQLTPNAVDFPVTGGEFTKASGSEGLV